ncbi:MAG TPA: RNA polymerase sigma factor [Gemmatimonadota bacterium]|jgi:RNA polymerase sigma-70 factor (ECF subfamily)
MKPPLACSTEDPDRAAADEARLVRSALAGETRAWGALVDLHGPALHRTCLRLLGDPDDAEDVVQEAFVRAWVRRADFDPARPFHPWIHRIARNLALNRLRRRRLWGLLPLSGVREPTAAERTEREAEDAELGRAVAACLAALPLPLRECFALRHEEELAYAAIAGMLGVPIGTVMSRLSRARARMRECLESKGVTSP